MILTPPRIIAIDDKPEHLAPILEAFQDLGAPCLGLLYDPQRGLESRHFRGVRVLVIDLNLMPYPMPTNAAPQFSAIASILDSTIHEHGGPFVLVIWTEHDDRVAELIEYLDDPEVIRPYARPLAIVGLPKSQFIDLTSGSVPSLNHLENAIQEEVLQKAPLAALLSWESEVLSATGETLSSLCDLVPNDKRSAATFTDELSGVLHTLACSSVGKQHVKADPRAAIVSVLSPLLADRIINQPETEDVQAVWHEAVGSVAAAGSLSASSGKLNRMIHVSVPRSEQIKPSGWGAVVEWPASFGTGGFKEKFGIDQDEFLRSELRITDPKLQVECTLRLVRVGAACDYAQNRTGPIQYLLGVEIPENVRKQKKQGLPNSIWHSPKLQIEPKSLPFLLAVHARFALYATETIAAHWHAQYRLREQLLMDLITHASNYQARPGIVSLP